MHSLWSPAALLRLSHLDALAELSDRARRQVSGRHPVALEWVEEASGLVADAEEVLAMAVAAARGRGASWEEIGERLGGGVTKQAAQKRFGARVDELQLDVLLPVRSGGDPPALGWTASSVAVDPEGTQRKLNRWVLSGREGPTIELWPRVHRATFLIGAVTQLASLVNSAFGPFATTEPPAGVTERSAWRRLLQYKLSLSTARLEESQSEVAARDERRQLAEALDQLTQLETKDAGEKLQVLVGANGRAFLTWPSRGERRTVAVLDHNETAGWWLWGPWEDVPHIESSWRIGVEVAADAPRELAERCALEQVAAWIGRDRATGIGPFDDGGIAGAPPADR